MSEPACTISSNQPNAEIMNSLEAEPDVIPTKIETKESINEPIQQELTVLSELPIIHSDKYFNFDEYMTPPKQKAIEKHLTTKEFQDAGLSSIEDLRDFELSLLDDTFNYSDGVWYLMDFENHREKLIENEHGITLSSQVEGSSPTLTYYKNSEKIESILISLKDYNDYLEKKNIEFKDFNRRHFQILATQKIVFQYN